MELEVHPVQVDVLRVLLFQVEARFTELNVGALTTDHFTFHVKRLVELGLIEKSPQGRYRLTAKGKEFANRFDTEAKVLERQAKLGVLVCGVRDKRKHKEYLMQQRLKQPYYGFNGFVTGKVKWGETIQEAAAREFKEETNLSGEPVLVGVKHKIDYDKEGKLLEDKCFFVFRVKNPAGQLTESFEGGRNSWMTEAEILKQENLFDGVDETLVIVEQKSIVFSETKYRVRGY